MTCIAPHVIFNLLQFDPDCCHAVLHFLEALPTLLYLLFQLSSSLVGDTYVFGHVAFEIDELGGQVSERFVGVSDYLLAESPGALSSCLCCFRFTWSP